MSTYNLTKQQIFDLEIKYTEIRPDNFKYTKNYYNTKKFWKGIDNKYCYENGLPINFILEYKDYLGCWETISKITMTEDNIRELKDYVYWDTISQYQYLSEDFIREFEDKISFYHLNMQTIKDCSIKFFKNYEKNKCMNWSFISKIKYNNHKFLKEFKDRVRWIDVYEYSEYYYDYSIIEIIEECWEFVRTSYVINQIKYAPKTNKFAKEVYNRLKIDGYIK